MLDNFSATSFEFRLAVITLAKKSFVVANIYRPANLSSSVSLEELSNLVANIYVDFAGNLLLLGDLNSPDSSPDTVGDDLCELLMTINLTEFVREQTRGKNLLDVVATDDPAAALDMTVDDCGLISDRRLVVFKTRTRIGRGRTIRYSYSNTEDLDTANLTGADGEWLD